MLSSVNAFSGLSSAELMTLFGTTASTASGAKSKIADQSDSTSISGSSTSDPATAIRTILAQAQIDQADIEQALTPSSTGGLSSSAPAPSESAAYSASVSDTLESAATGMTWEPAGQMASYHVSVGSQSSASGAVDTVQFGVSMGGVSVNVGFALEGIGQVDLDPGGAGINIGQGDLTDSFQIGIAADGYGVAVGFSVSGLDATEAQQLGAAFEAATSAPDTGTAPNAGYTDTLAGGYSVNFLQVTGYTG